MHRRFSRHLLLLCLIAAGCAPRITPPAAPRNPVGVAVADNGRHTSLIVPVEGGLEEFAWGDYPWFALNRNSKGDALAALFWSKGATLGVRHFPGASIEQDLPALSGAKRVLRFEASAGEVASLRNKLDGAFRAQIARGEIYNESSKMFFVHDRERYWFAHNCNHVTARWLREIGCRIDGLVLFSNFTLNP